MIKKINHIENKLINEGDGCESIRTLNRRQRGRQVKMIKLL